jgi:hypothetical protein
MKTSFVKVLSILLFGILSIFANPSFAQRKSSSDVYVKSYVKSNGTVVEGHMRSAPDKTAGNNFSTKGNVNPYTGEAGTVIAPSGGSIGSGSPSTVSPSQSETTSSDVNVLAARISKLEATVETLSKKVDGLIGRLSTVQVLPRTTKLTPTKSAIVVIKPKPVGNVVVGSKAAWRGLSRGMTKAQAKRFVGEPERVDVNGDGYTTWWFDGKWLYFEHSGRLARWNG